MSAVDPFTQTYQAVRAALLAWPGFASLVKSGNFPDVTSDKFLKFRGSVAPNDLPEVLLIQGGFNPNPFGSNSKISAFTQSLPLISTFLNLQAKPANIYKTQVMAALLKAGDDIGMPGLIRSYKITGAADDMLSNSAWKRGSIRMSTVLTINVDCYLSKTDLLTKYT